MKSLITVAALTSVALTSVALTSTALTDLVAAPVDLSKYHLSDCTKGYLPDTAGVMTGIEVNEERKYAYCVVTTRDSTFFDYKCLCRGGDGEGSAIIDAALIAGHVGHVCGWDYSFHVVFPETISFCRTLLNEDAATDHGQFLERYVPTQDHPAIVDPVVTDELPDLINKNLATVTTRRSRRVRSM